jgi:hypothetical protein
MRSMIALMLAVLTLASCSAPVSNDPKPFVQQLMHDAGKDSAKITNVVEGNSKYRQADALWCVATDLMLEDGQIPYLLAVWRKGDKWEGNQLEQGYYEWDLYGCPR